MKYYFAIIPGILYVIICSGCGQKGSLIDAQNKLPGLVEEFRRKSEEDIQVFKPLPASNPQKIDSPAEKTKIDPRTGKRIVTKYVQFVSGRWLYTFGDLQKDTLPYSITAEAHLFYTYYEPIPERKYKDFETRTGELYDPSHIPVVKRVKARIDNILFEYNMETAEWEEKERKTVFPQKKGDTESGQ